MNLKELKIIKDGTLCRKVNFRQGLNLITNDKKIGHSGNSVGKSTLPRVIDFMFLGSIEPIYIDDEYSRPNKDIESLFKNHDVECELSFLDTDKNLHVLVRNLGIGKEEIFCIDGEEVSKNIYEKSILKLCFDIVTPRPSLRFLAPKFIRNNSFKMLHTTRFLDENRTDNDYAELFLYLFGFTDTSLLTQKRQAYNLAKRKKSRRTVLNALLKEQKTKSELRDSKKQFTRLEKSIFKENFDPDISDPIGSLYKIQMIEDDLNNQIFNSLLRIDNITQTIDSLKGKGDGYLISEMKAIYEFAGVAIENVSRSFEETLSFHQNLVEKKITFVESQLPELLQKHKDLEDELKVSRLEKQSVFSKMRSHESLDKVSTNIKLLADIRDRIVKLEGVVDQQALASSEYDSALVSFNKIVEKVSEQIEKVHTFEQVFLTIFENFTKYIHNEAYRFTLNFDQESGLCLPLVENLNSNPEGGKKKAEVIAFDLAYINSCYQEGLKRPEFVVHDSVDDIDEKQIIEIFSLAETQLEGQLIISMLSDKFSDDVYDKYIDEAILLLSDDDKFFSI